jgi:hypothetical protein
MTAPGEHTQGPWAYTCAHWTGHGQDTYSVYHYAWGPLAYTAGPSDYGPSRAEANARLMAAAPELLEALEEVLGLASQAHSDCEWENDTRCEAEGYGDGNVDEHLILRNAMAAIAKAKGELE